MLHLVLSAVLPPAEDELYYWTWSRTLQWSYFDHPPVVAYLIRLSTSIFGNSLFGLRFFACLAGLGVLAILGKLCGGKRLVTWLIGCPLFLIGSLLMTPDVPFLFFWTLYLYWMVHVSRRFSEWNDDPVSRVYRQSPVSSVTWAAGGLVLGLGILSKYTMFLAVPCTLLVLWRTARWQAWWRGLGILFLVTVVVTSPILIYNVQHAFEPLKFQWHHILGARHESGGRFWEFIGIQILMVGALPFIALPWVLVRTPDLWRNPTLNVCWFFYVPPLFFFFYKAMSAPLEANWALAAYLSFWPIATAIIAQSSFHGLMRGLVGISFAIPIVLSFLFFVHAVAPLKFITPEMDRLGSMRTMRSMAEAAARDYAAAVQSGKVPESTPLVATNYQWTSFFRFSGVPGAKQLMPPNRPSHFTQRDSEDTCALGDVVLFEELPPQSPLVGCLPRREVLAAYPFVVRGKEITRFELVWYRRAQTGSLSELGPVFPLREGKP